MEHSMSSIVYFIPGEMSLPTTDRAPESWPFHDAIRDATCLMDVREIEGERGLYVSPKLVGTGKPDLNMLDDVEMFWVRLNSYWLGCRKGEKVLPEKVARDEELQVRGYTWDTGDGMVWICPAISSPRENVGPPMVYSFDKDLNPTREVKSEFQDLWRLAKRTTEHAQNGFPGDDLEYFRWAVQFFGVNYRVGPAEIHLMKENGQQMFDTQWVTKVLMAACDWFMVDEFQKKTQNPETPDSSQDATRSHTLQS